MTPVERAKELLPESIFANGVDVPIVWMAVAAALAEIIDERDKMANESAEAIAELEEHNTIVHQQLLEQEEQVAYYSDRLDKADNRIADLWSENQRLWQPMECGHPGACYSPLPTSGNEPPPKNWPPDCLECRAITAAHVEGLREALGRLQQSFNRDDAIDSIKAEIIAIERSQGK